jgi:NO-binding membrane sensor protein with MHYT domain
MPSEYPVLVGFHDHRLVVLPVFISILAAYAARDLSDRIRDARGRI